MESADCTIGDAGAIALAEGLTHQNNKVTTLYLNGTCSRFYLPFAHFEQLFLEN